MTVERSSRGSRDDGSNSMGDPSLSRRALLGGSVAGLASIAGCGAVDVVVGKREHTEWSYSLPTGTLRIDVKYADVTIRKSMDDSAQVQVQKKGSLLSSIDAVEVTARKEAGTVIVESKTTGGGILSNPPDVNIDIELPSGATVEEAHTGNDDVRAKNVAVKDGARISTVNGNATLTDVTVRTPSTSGEDDTAIGTVTISTENGDAVARDVEGFVDVETTNGDATIRNCAGVLGATSTNGDVGVDVTAIRSDTGLETTNGDVTAALSSGLDAHVIAETTNGEIEVRAFPGTLQTNTGTYAEGTIGEGSHDLRLVTTNGDVEITNSLGDDTGGERA